MGLLSQLLADLPLVDAHCHPLPDPPLEVSALSLALTEADRFPPGVNAWDTSVGLAVRRWCAATLGLAADSPATEYLQARSELGIAEVTRRLLRTANLSCLLIDTGLPGDPDATAEAAGASWHEVVRLEWVAEQVAATGVGAAEFASAYVNALVAAARDAVAVKSILAYRHGFDVDPARPTTAQVAEAAGEWLARSPRGAGLRLDHPVLLRFALWSGLDLGLPVQVHAGFGDRDLALPRSDPALLQPLLAAAEPIGVPIVLLHCYPYHRQAGWLAQVYPHVYVDLGLTMAQVGAHADRVLAELCELTPFGKLLFSTDGCRIPEMYLVGAAQFRHSFQRVLETMPSMDRERVARLVGGDNARHVYRLAGVSGA